MDKLWMKDKYLKEIMNRIDDYEVYSFDVFDTLLFRICKDTQYVYEEVAKEMELHFDDWKISSKEYAILRENARRIARGKKPFEMGCTYREIFSNIPFDEEKKMRLMVLEVEKEKEVLFLNPNMYSLVQYLYEQGKKVIITSDMYFGKDIILSLLKDAGMDLKLISECYVSSEYDALKVSGGLFRCVLKDLNVDVPSRILHIGDNVEADVKGANQVGIHSLLYSVLDKKFASIYDCENNIYKVDLDELFAIRNIASISQPIVLKNEENMYFQMGACVVAPVLESYLYSKNIGNKNEVLNYEVDEIFEWLCENYKRIDSINNNRNKKILEHALKNVNCQLGINSYFSISQEIANKGNNIRSTICRKKEELYKVWDRWFNLPLYNEVVF